jgi:hypothetical protein
VRIPVQRAVRTLGIVMTSTSHLYRRGHQYWYRASLTIAPHKRIDVRLSLRTDSLFLGSFAVFLK